MNKLTLSVEEPIVEKARKIAEANKTSVSAMFSQFIESIASKSDQRVMIGPLTRKLSGVISLQEDVKCEDLVTDALMEKYKIYK